MRLRYYVGILLGLVCLLGGLCGCETPGEEDPFAYADKAFSATVRGSFTRIGEGAAAGEERVGVAVPVAATVSVAAPTTDGERPMTLTFSEPAALAGVRVSRDTAGQVTVTFPGTPRGPTWTDTTGAFNALLRFATVLLPAGDIVAVTPTVDGTRTVTVEGGGRRVAYTGTGGSLPTAVIATDGSERLELTVTPVT